MIRMMHHFMNILAEESRIAHTVGRNVGFFTVVILFTMVVSLEPTSHNHQDNDDAHHADGVGDGTTQGSHCRRLSQLFECLLCSTECRCVGGGSTKHPHEVGKGQPSHQCDAHCHDSTDDDDSEGKNVEPRTSMFEGRYKTRSHL